LHVFEFFTYESYASKENEVAKLLISYNFCKQSDRTGARMANNRRFSAYSPHMAAVF
jgi:hypothetical protein